MKYLSQNRVRQKNKKKKTTNKKGGNIEIKEEKKGGEVRDLIFRIFSEKKKAVIAPIPPEQKGGRSEFPAREKKRNGTLYFSRCRWRK